MQVWQNPIHGFNRCRSHKKLSRRRRRKKFNGFLWPSKRSQSHQNLIKWCIYAILMKTGRIRPSDSRNIEDTISLSRWQNMPWTTTTKRCWMYVIITTEREDTPYGMCYLKSSHQSCPTSPINSSISTIFFSSSHKNLIFQLSTQFGIT